jgi:hypothetical protein
MEHFVITPWSRRPQNFVFVGNAYGFLVGKHEVKRPDHRWEDNIKVNLKEIGCELDHERDQWWAIVSVVIRLHVP